VKCAYRSLLDIFVGYSMLTFLSSNFQAWKVKKIAEEQRNKKGIERQGSADSETEPTLVLPHLADRLESRAYKPGKKK